MAEKEIALLKEQMERLHDARFDLEAWKNQTIIFMDGSMIKFLMSG